MLEDGGKQLEKMQLYDAITKRITEHWLFFSDCKLATLLLVITAVIWYLKECYIFPYN